MVERVKKCDEALGVLQKSLIHLEKTCGKLGWNLDKVLESPSLVVCPLSKGHRLPEKKLKEHLETCTLRHRGLSKDEIASLPPSSFPFYEKAPAVRSLVMTDSLQSEILGNAFGPHHVGVGKVVPPSPDRAVAELSVEERSALYDYVAEKLSDGKNSESQITLLNELQMLQELLEERETEQNMRDDGQHLDPKEAIAMERDFHRRRRTYRGVHTDRKSHTEVLRDVIARQMELVEEVMTARRRLHEDRRASDRSASKRKASDSQERKVEEKHSKKKKKKESKSAKKPKKSKKKKSKKNMESKSSESISD